VDFKNERINTVLPYKVDIADAQIISQNFKNQIKNTLILILG
jgi:hypothetical protein